jgi:hypothetical protein
VRDLTTAVFSDGWTSVNHHAIVNIVMGVRSLHTLRETHASTERLMNVRAYDNRPSSCKPVPSPSSLCYLLTRHLLLPPLLVLALSFTINISSTSFGHSSTTTSCRHTSSPPRISIHCAVVFVHTTASRVGLRVSVLIFRME